MSERESVAELFKANLRGLRRRRGLTQRELAEKLGVGRVAVTHWESGWSRPNLRMLPAIAEVLGCEIADLFEPIEERVA